MFILFLMHLILCFFPRRCYSLEKDLSDAEAFCYLSNYGDLKDAFGDNTDLAKRHWISFGRLENRVSDCFIFLKYEKEFVKSLDSSIYFVSNGLLYRTVSCKPCGPSKSICDNGMPVHVLEKKYLLSSKIQQKTFDCAAQFPEAWEGYNNAIHRLPLRLKISELEPPRLNILMTGVGRDFTGGPLSIMHFAN
eukprot:gene37595-50753_t